MGNVILAQSTTGKTNLKKMMPSLFVDVDDIWTEWITHTFPRRDGFELIEDENVLEQFRNATEKRVNDILNEGMILLTWDAVQARRLQLSGHKVAIFSIAEVNEYVVRHVRRNKRRVEWTLDDVRRCRESYERTIDNWNVLFPSGTYVSWQELYSNDYLSNYLGWILNLFSLH